MGIDSLRRRSAAFFMEAILPRQSVNSVVSPREPLPNSIGHASPGI
jgi:hypothetical protein